MNKRLILILLEVLMWLVALGSLALAIFIIIKFELNGMLKFGILMLSFAVCFVVAIISKYISVCENYYECPHCGYKRGFYQNHEDVFTPKTYKVCPRCHSHLILKKIEK